MKIKISKSLESILARTAFDTSKAGITHSLKDFFLLELLRQEGVLAYQILHALLKDWELYQIRLRIESELPTSSGELQNPETFFSELAEELCRQDEQTHSISTAHALLHILRDGQTIGARVLAMYHITPELIAREMHKFTNGDNHTPKIQGRILDFSPLNAPQPSSPQLDFGQSNAPVESTRLLEKFGTDLTDQARQGKIDPVVGRDAEIERMVQILSRRKKNNPILIGEAGVGKSAIVEGLALRIAAGQTPHTIAGKRLFSLDISSLVAGTKFRGEFEERMQQLMDELRRAKDTILFIDEIHTIVGAGSTQGSLDTANILKPALAHGQLQTIGATTLNEYRENIEHDAALERRFQKVLVAPTTPEQTLQILRNIAPHYQLHHKVHYTEEALRACVSLTDRYITDRYFPDKAIDVLDEAGARQHLHTTAETVAISAAEIAQVVTSMTGIPAERITCGELDRLRGLREYLTQRVIGQSEAVEKISRSILRSRTGLTDEHRPIGVFLFVGPTGVGKTLLAKEISKWLFDERKGLIRIDMSEYGEKHNVSRLIGSPPGYVGYGQGGQLTEAIRRQPYAVVLLDEIEKAHPEVLNILLQLFDEGHLTDGAGRKVDFRNTILVMTSNVGSRAVQQRTSQVGYSTLSKSATALTRPQSEYRKALEQTFSPEFLNRVDDVVIFRTLEIPDVEQIIELELQTLFERTTRLGYKVKITTGAKRRLATLGYQARYGARALKRTLTDRIEEPICTMILDEQLHQGDTVVVESDRAQGVKLRVA